MSEQDESTEKSFEPTPKRLEEARRKGDVPKSNDLTTAATYFAVVLVLASLGAAGASIFATPMANLISASHELTRSPEAWSGPDVFADLFVPMSPAMASIFLVPALAALLSVVAQRAFTVAPSKIAPKLNRISPIQGAKNKFGANGIFEFLKSGTKLVVISVGAFFFIIWNLDVVLGSVSQEPGQVLLLIGKLVIEFTLLASLVMLLIGGVDYIWQTFEHRRKNMMSRKEIEDETKEAEGDPHLKQARRSRAQEIATNQMLSDVPQADVVIVNPTHFAVALKWDRSSEGAPVCVAKGVDEIAARIREIAGQSRVPIYSDPPTARAIFATVDIGRQIDPGHYRAVAAAVRYAERARRKSRRSLS